MKARKKICANCKFADKRNGPANWSCSNPAAFADKKCDLPPHFPRVLSNDRCEHFKQDEEINKD